MDQDLDRGDLDHGDHHHRCLGLDLAHLDQDLDPDLDLDLAGDADLLVTTAIMDAMFSKYLAKVLND